MSGYKHFAIAGAGDIGGYILDALVQKQSEGIISSISVLSRSSNAREDLVAKGVKFITVNYDSPASLESALSGIDVVISTLGLTALAPQQPLAVASKAAGVKLFVPSEFGGDTDGATDHVFREKENLKKKHKELDLPYASFYTGPFNDLFFARDASERTGFDFANKKIVIHGSGTAPISWTTRADIARYVAHVLTTLSKDKIEWRHFRIEGDRASFNKIVADWQAHSGQALEVLHKPRSDLEEVAAKNPADLLSSMLLQFDSGDMIVGKSGELTNDEFPEWKPKNVIEVLDEIYGQRA